MCGIITKIKRTDDGVSTATEILAMLEKQIHRGREGFGYVSFNDDITMWCRRQSLEEIKTAISKNTSRSIVFHHRLPTSTPNYADCTHPIKVSHKELKHDYYFIHNGVISNDDMLKEEHEELGYEYITKVTTEIRTKNSKFVGEEQFNDSEALAIDVVRYVEGKQTEIKSKGSIAFVMVQVKKNKSEVLRVFYGRNSSPLHLDFTEESLTLRSEGGTGNIDANKMFCLDLKKWQVTEEDCNIGQLESTVNHYGYGSGHGSYYGGTYTGGTYTKQNALPYPKDTNETTIMETVTDVDGTEYYVDKELANEYDKLQDLGYATELELQNIITEQSNLFEKGYAAESSIYDVQICKLESELQNIEEEMSNILASGIPVKEIVVA